MTDSLRTGYTLLPPPERPRPTRGQHALDAIERAIRESEAYFRSLVENARDVIHVINADRTTRYITPSVQRLLGWDPEELVGRSALDLVHPDDVDRVTAVLTMDRYGRAGGGTLEFRAMHRDGSVRIFEAIGKNLLEDPVVHGVIVNSRDVSERRRAEQETARLAAFARENPSPILECDAGGTPRYVNPAGDRLVAELGLRTPAELLPDEHAALVHACLRTGEGLRGVEMAVGRRVFAWTYHPQRGTGTVHLFGEEVSERKRVQERLLHNAMHDVLTGLPNRNFFLERLTATLRHREKHGPQPFAVLFLDLDRFKVVNDSLGHHVGDELLVEVADRLRAAAPAGSTVARFGGDEFAVLLDEVQGEAGARAVALRLADAVAAPLQIGGYELFTSASVGIALEEGGGEGPETLLRNADMAMYRAKGSGAARCEVFDRAMHDAAILRLELENDLRRAVERNEFVLHYQPIVSLHTGMVNGMEALLRWEHPRRGLIAPGEFIPAAEETGAILAIGDWVLREGCRQLAEWRAEFPRARVAMSINLSAKQFSQRDLVEKIAATLRDTGLDPRHLKLEITESTLLENTELTHLMLRQLKEFGIQIQMDDFGTGYSSLSSLHRLPIDALKVDRSFVARMGEENGTAPLVRTIAVLAQGLGLAVIAEGVETPEQLEAVRDMGCDYAQGFLISHPVGAHHIRDILRAGHYD
ncbi:MAG TPA: EAL domain-containing protein [Longimicrobiaceae bacterium]|nr:EAL domain-containing protein [Longimicrobiaceae bacterium]